MIKELENLKNYISLTKLDLSVIVKIKEMIDKIIEREKNELQKRIKPNE